jgi:hypothetical protein
MKAEVKVWEGIEMMSQKKMERRRELAKLPFEKKISILKLLQRIANQILQHPGENVTMSGPDVISTTWVERFIVQSSRLKNSNRPILKVFHIFRGCKAVLPNG